MPYPPGRRTWEGAETDVDCGRARMRHQVGTILFGSRAEDDQCWRAIRASLTIRRRCRTVRLRSRGREDSVTTRQYRPVGMLPLSARRGKDGPWRGARSIGWWPFRRFRAGAASEDRLGRPARVTLNHAHNGLSQIAPAIIRDEAGAKRLQNEFLEFVPA